MDRVYNADMVQMIARQSGLAALLCGAALALALALAAGCSQQSTSGEPTGTGVLTGYEIGNQQDIQDQRKERPEYRRFE